MRALLLALLLVTPAYAAESSTTAAPSILSAPDSPSEVKASVTLKVSKKDEVSDALIAKTEELGGYLSNMTNQGLTLRVPVASVGALLNQAALLGIVIERSWSSSDLSAQIVDKRARLEARESVLSRYFDVLGSASPDAVVSVERQIVGLVGEIEQLKGGLRLLENQASFATFTVAFQYRDRVQPTRDGSSSFAWLNRVNLADLVEGFRKGWHHANRRPGLAVTVPEGFAAFKEHRRYTAAVSPDSVLFLARAEAHDPEATLAFWQEALRKRMVEAGYRVLSEANVSIDGKAGYRLELGAPYGNDDYTYMIVVVPNGSRLEIIEAAGEVSRFGKRRAALLAALGGDGTPIVTPPSETTPPKP